MMKHTQQKHTQDALPLSSHSARLRTTSFKKQILSGSSRFLLCLFLLCLVINGELFAGLILPSLFSDHAVLQRGRPVLVWGKSDSGASVVVSIAGKTVKTVANDSGDWEVDLGKLPVGGPYTLKVEDSSGEKVVREDLLVGDVWVCSGQSNMEFSTARASNAKKECKEAGKYSKIRFLKVGDRVAQYKQADLLGECWVKCSEKTVKNFTAVGYYFGRKLHQDLEVPVGLIVSSWGGTKIEMWTSGDSIGKDPDFKETYEAWMKQKMADVENARVENIRKLLGGVIPTHEDKKILSDAVYAQVDYDDGDWSEVKASCWEAQGYGYLDGIAWYRKEVNLDAQEIKKVSGIGFGNSDFYNSFMIWVNGVQVGESKIGKRSGRVYDIQAGVLREGGNVISIRVNNKMSNGGLVKNSKDGVYFIRSGKKMILSDSWKVKFTEVHLENAKIGRNDYPAILFNGMISPLTKYAIKGVIWYQGESNAGQTKQYRRLFSSMIKDWRKAWGYDFPFLFVSLANYNKVANNPNARSSWAELREAQTLALSLKNTGMALAIDVGDAGNIHPKNKKSVGERLALAALKVAYKQKDGYVSPLYKSHKVVNDKIEVTFSDVGGGLMANDGLINISGFAIAGADGKFVWANAKIIAKDKVLVWSAKVRHPKMIRYAWANNPGELNLYSKEKLPVNPFRTDK